MIITFEIDVDTDIIRLHKPHSFGKQFLFCEKNPQKELLYQSTCLHNMVYFLYRLSRGYSAAQKNLFALVSKSREQTLTWKEKSHETMYIILHTIPVTTGWALCSGPTLYWSPPCMEIGKVIRIDCYSVFQSKIDKNWKRSVCINCSLRDWPVLTIHPSSDTRIPLANPLRKVVVPEPSRGKCRKSHEHYPWLQSWKTSERQKRKVSLICIDYNST